MANQKSEEKAVTLGAMRAACAINNECFRKTPFTPQMVRRWGRVISRETHDAELIEALKAFIAYDWKLIVGAKAALKSAKGEL